jgi:hypothetical protein
MLYIHIKDARIKGHKVHVCKNQEPDVLCSVSNCMLNRNSFVPAVLVFEIIYVVVYCLRCRCLSV